MAFQAIMDTIEDKATEPFCIETPQGRMLFAVIRRKINFFRFDTTFSERDKRLWGCEQCCATGSKFRYHFIGGIPLLVVMNGPLHDPDETNRLAEIKRIYVGSHNDPIDDIQILRQPEKNPAKKDQDPGLLQDQQKYLGGFLPRHGGFDHLNLPLPTDIPDETLVLYQALYNRYIKQGQLTRLIEKALLQGPASFDIMIASCDKVSSTDKYLPALKWVKEILTALDESPIPLSKMDLLQQFMFLMPFLLQTHFAPDASDGVVSFHCLYLKECIDKLLGKAEDISDLEKKMARNTDPAKLGIKTAPASDRQLQSFQQMVGPFTVTAADPNILPNSVLTSQPVDPGAAVAPPATGFAARVSKTEIIRSIKTISDLCNYLADKPSTPVYIQKFNGGVCTIANTTMDQQYLSVPYFWGFPQEKDGKFVSPESYGMRNEWLKVTHIIAMWKDCMPHTCGRLTMFVIEGATFPNSLRIGNGIFLNALYHAHERAFQDSLPMMTINHGPIALGLGVSTQNQYNNINPTNFRVDGVDIKISRLF